MCHWLCQCLLLDDTGWHLSLGGQWLLPSRVFCLSVCLVSGGRAQRAHRIPLQADSSAVGVMPSQFQIRRRIRRLGFQLCLNFCLYFPVFLPCPFVAKFLFCLLRFLCETLCALRFKTLVFVLNSASAASSAVINPKPSRHVRSG